MPRTILIIALFAASLLMASEPYPGSPTHHYFSELWAPSSITGNYYSQVAPLDSLNITWTVKGSIVSGGYPYHYGAVWGVNDTVVIIAYFDNNSVNDVSLLGVQPQDWFVPVLYDPDARVSLSKPIADTSAFGYRFEHWVNMINDFKTDKPDTLLSKPIQDWRVKPRGIQISIWGLYPGRYRAVLVPTSAKPSNVNLVMSSPFNDFMIVKGNHVKDTINAYVSIATRAYQRQEWTFFDIYIDSIYYRNPKALPRWLLQYSKYAAMADTGNAKMATDSVLYYLENFVDPLLPDSSNLDEVHRAWYTDAISLFKYLRWRLRNPDEAITIFP